MAVHTRPDKQLAFELGRAKLDRLRHGACRQQQLLVNILKEHTRGETVGRAKEWGSPVSVESRTILYLRTTGPSWLATRFHSVTSYSPSYT